MENEKRPHLSLVKPPPERPERTETVHRDYLESAARYLWRDAMRHTEIDRLLLDANTNPSLRREIGRILTAAHRDAVVLVESANHELGVSDVDWNRLADELAGR